MLATRRTSPARDRSSLSLLKLRLVTETRVLSSPRSRSSRLSRRSMRSKRSRSRSLRSRLELLLCAGTQSAHISNRAAESTRCTTHALDSDFLLNMTNRFPSSKVRNSLCTRAFEELCAQSPVRMRRVWMKVLTAEELRSGSGCS